MEIKICRICLALDVKVFKIGNSEAKSFIEDIFKQNGYKQDLQETHYICFECKALLDKSYKFIKRVLKAQNILFNIVKEKKIITPTIFKQIDRSITGYNLVKDFKSIDVFITEDDQTIKTENVEVECKVEVCELNVQDPLHNPVDKYDVYKNETEIDFGLVKSDSSTETDTKGDLKNENFKFNEEKIDYDSFDDYDETQYEFNDTFLVEQLKEEIDDATHTQIIEKREREYLSRSSKTSDEASIINANVKNRTKRSKANERKGKKRKNAELDKYGCVDLNQQIEVLKYKAKCAHCNYDAPNRMAHFHHYLLEHRDKKYPYTKQTGKQFVCQYCGLVNSMKSRHIDHELTHGTINNFTCAHCPKSFVNRNRLQKHTYRSHPLQMLECDYCGKKVKSRGSLMIHIRIHTGERPFKCPFCGAGFAHKGNIRPHIRTNHEQSIDNNIIKTNKRKTKYKASDNQIFKPEDTSSCASEMFMI